VFVVGVNGVAGLGTGRRYLEGLPIPLTWRRLIPQDVRLNQSQPSISKRLLDDPAGRLVVGQEVEHVAVEEHLHRCIVTATATSRTCWSIHLVRRTFSRTGPAFDSDDDHVNPTDLFAARAMPTAITPHSTSYFSAPTKRSTPSCSTAPS
jgi:hypothetical protein